MKKTLSIFLAVLMVITVFPLTVITSFAINASVSADNTISINNLSRGSYTLRYKNDEGVLSEYAQITSFEIEDEIGSFTYCGFISENRAPVEATAIGVYNSSNVLVCSLELSFLSMPDIGEKKYSFAAISDTHIGSKTSEDDFKKALTYFENDSDIAFTTICGDLTLAGTNENLALYKSIVDNYSTKPVYGISGNHEANRGCLNMDALKPYTGQDLYYSFTYNNDVYIMVGMYDVYGGQEFAEGELQWLYETLEANKDKRCFVFMHLFPRDGSGDAIDLDLEGDMLNNTQGEVFYSLISHYSNVIYFHGHSHEKFQNQELHKMNTYDNIFGCHSIHVPSLAYPKHVENGKLIADYNASEGYVVDVYDSAIVLRGRDFVTDEFLPIATYSLDTSAKTIEENTYYDSTGTVINLNSNVLKPMGEWYCGDFDKSKITKITFTDVFKGNFDESFNASMSNESNVTVYRTGTELTVVGNENGIVANSDSSEMFSGFTSLVEIVGLENVNKANIEKMLGMFKNCKSLKMINLSSFKDIKPNDLIDVFNGCSSLEEVDISNLDLSNVKKYNSLFSNCTSLKTVSFGENVSVNQSTVYLAGTFYNCVSLKEMDLSAFTHSSVSLASCFNMCTSLEFVELPHYINAITKNTFSDCSSLKSVAIPDSVTSIDINAFLNCTSLKYVYFAGDEATWENISISNGNDKLIASAIHYNVSAEQVNSHWSDWTISEPTCETTGTKIRTCHCGETETETISALGHDFADEFTVDQEATCTTDGSKSRHCSRCDEVTEITAIPATGHTFGEWTVTLEPTCETTGTKIRTCHCGETETETISALGHDFDDEFTVDQEATCTTDGSKSKHCSRCDEVTEITAIPATGHTFGEWNTTLEPTCETTGTKIHTCHCGETETETISALGHDFADEFTVDIEPTYEKDGSKSRHCSRCDEVTDVTVIPKLEAVKNGWTLENGKWAYYENGVKVTNRWLKDSVGWCYVGADGYCVTNKWVKDSHGWCYLDANGRMATNKWIKDSVGWCYVGADGYCVTNKWVKDSHGWCYLDSNGRMATNQWIKDSKGWCYVGADGYCVTNAWKADSKGWCYLDSNGRMMTNSWLQWNGNWYYLDGNGYMVTGTKVIDGKTYKFNSNGVLIG